MLECTYKVRVLGIEIGRLYRAYEMCIRDRPSAAAMPVKLMKVFSPIKEHTFSFFYSIVLKNVLKNIL